jgi:hypothetical protein
MPATDSLIEGSDQRRFYVVLHPGGIRSPLDAVRAAIVVEHGAMAPAESVKKSR